MTIGFTLPSINAIWSWITMGLFAGLAIPMFLRWYWWRFNGWGFNCWHRRGGTGIYISEAIFAILANILLIWNHSPGITYCIARSHIFDQPYRKKYAYQFLPAYQAVWSLRDNKKWNGAWFG